MYSKRCKNVAANKNTSRQEGVRTNWDGSVVVITVDVMLMLMSLLLLSLMLKIVILITDVVAKWRNELIHSLPDCIIWPNLMAKPDHS